MSLGDAEDTDFLERHLGPSRQEIEAMLAVLELPDLDALSDRVVPEDIRYRKRLATPEARPLARVTESLQAIASKNRRTRSLIGMGYVPCVVPPVLRRNLFENPAWYTAYTPYQAEIAQGRLEALMNFQTMVADLTGLPVANASLLDEATAVAESMSMCVAITRHKRNRFWVAKDLHPQVLSVLATRAAPLGIEVEPVDPDALVSDPDRWADPPLGLCVAYPATDGVIRPLGPLAALCQSNSVPLVVTTDLLALTLLEPPGAVGADIVVGSAQRFGVPMGAGGPHAAFLATQTAHQRLVPGRIIGASKDAEGRVGYRLALQTREQHIRRDRATSNICTAQVLLAVMAGMYAVHHGPEGLLRIASRIRGQTYGLRAALARLGLDSGDAPAFDTLRVRVPEGAAADIHARAAALGLRFRAYDNGDVGVTLGEGIDETTLDDVLQAFAGDRVRPQVRPMETEWPASLQRKSAYLSAPVFHRYRSEHELMRYLRVLADKDLALDRAMIPLGSCTMKLNAAAEMEPVSWADFADLHPYAPAEDLAGYAALVTGLERMLAEITGMDAVSMQPNAGSQGEFAGLLAIRGYHRSRGDDQRDVCLIPASAHGTNPASAVMAGMKVVPVRCDERGNIDLADLGAQLEKHGDRVAALMVTYPSTHGVFEPTIREVCQRVHEVGGQVYLDGANMNAQVGLARPGDYGADVCHLNLHKTFCIPHGGGGPGMGPIAMRSHLAPHMPSDPVAAPEGAVSAAPWGSPSILPIPWVYLRAMGPDGLRTASQVAILGANYMAARLRPHYPILYTGAEGWVAHEFLIDLRPFKKTAGIEVEDVAKRLMDYGFHAPTMSFPVPGTMMIEPTESESKEEMDRFCDAMIQIRDEIRQVEANAWPRDDNPLKRAPHTAEDLVGDWTRAYDRKTAVFPAGVSPAKYWPPVGRIDNAYGDRNLICTCSVPAFDASDASG